MGNKADLYKKSNPHGYTTEDKTGKVATLRHKIGCSAEDAVQLLERSNYNVGDAEKLFQYGILPIINGTKSVTLERKKLLKNPRVPILPDASDKPNPDPSIKRNEIHFEIWRAGARATSISSAIKPTKIGEADGVTFQEACYKLLKSNEHFNFSNCTIYGLPLFPSEEAAKANVLDGPEFDPTDYQ